MIGLIDIALLEKLLEGQTGRRALRTPGSVGMGNGEAPGIEALDHEKEDEKQTVQPAPMMVDSGLE